MLFACTAALLAESWFIERSGIGFCARMAVLAESLEERRLYAVIGADEAIHCAWLEPWMEMPREADPFNRFIESLIAAGSAQPLAYLLQVVLEGFGIVHYAGLARDCRDSALADTLRTMAQDEALHHAAGLAAFRATSLSLAERTFLFDGAYEFLQMVRSGPQSVIACIDRHIGVGSEADAAAAFADLDGEAAAAHKLARLRRLMTQPGMEDFVEELTRRGAFTPCTPTQSARIYAAARSSLIT